jgi:hypothetical protein
VIRARLAIALTVGWLGAAGCSHPAPDATPDGAVRAWLERMEATDDDPRALRDAYALLGPTARGNLDERARRASQVEGHRVEPWDMIAEGRFGLKFRPKVMVAHVQGDTATVDVTGDEPAERARVTCVRAEGPPPGWRVEPELPPVPQLPQRDPDPVPPRDDRR